MQKDAKVPGYAEGWISVVLNTPLFEVKYRVGTTHGSVAMIVVGALFGRYLWWIDGAMGIGVSLLILWATIDILRSAATALLGEKPTEELEDRLGALISRETPTATHFHHLHVHTYGGHRELTFHLDFPPDMRLHEAYVLASRVESAVRRELSAEATIHIEPSDA